MGKKIFISYKYADTNVQRLNIASWFENTTVRHYVDEFEKLLENEDHIFKGESDGEDLSNLSEETIAQKLKDRIYDSSITIVFVSKGMKEWGKNESKQWIPWEISYSLKEISRGGRTSLTNAVLAVILPDENGSYEYFIQYNSQCNSTTLMTDFLFPIMRKNMFNILNPSTSICNENTLYHGYSSYIHSVKWVDFKAKYNDFIDISTSIYENKGSYDIKKELE
jgi:hypothetical protein